MDVKLILNPQMLSDAPSYYSFNTLQIVSINWKVSTYCDYIRLKIQFIKLGNLF